MTTSSRTPFRVWVRGHVDLMPVHLRGEQSELWRGNDRRTMLEFR